VVSCSDVVVAVAQLHVDEGDVDANLARCESALADARAAHAGLLVLPECALTGYRYDSAADVREFSLDARDERLRALADAAVAAHTTIVVGYLERSRDAVHNTAAVLGADGAVHHVRKTHLPALGADRFVTAGDRLGEVVDTPAGRVGVAICYDFRFPEVARALALARAEVIAVPVNWSTDVAVLSQHVVPARAVENRVFVAVADRAGTAAGVTHLGASQIVDPAGERLTAALDPCADVVVTTAVIDPWQARTKAMVFAPGRFAIDVFADRRPGLYGTITEEQHHDA
jgi:predicted amidohydrolase